MARLPRRASRLGGRRPAPIRASAIPPCVRTCPRTGGQVRASRITETSSFPQRCLLARRRASRKRGKQTRQRRWHGILPLLAFLVERWQCITAHCRCQTAVRRRVGGPRLAGACPVVATASPPGERTTSKVRYALRRPGGSLAAQLGAASRRALSLFPPGLSFRPIWGIMARVVQRYSIRAAWAAAAL